MEEEEEGAGFIPWKDTNSFMDGFGYRRSSLALCKGKKTLFNMFHKLNVSAEGFKPTGEEPNSVSSQIL